MTNKFLKFNVEVALAYHKPNPGSLDSHCGRNQNKNITPELFTFYTFGLVGISDHTYVTWNKDKYQWCMGFLKLYLEL